MTRPLWLFMPLLACTSQNAEQRALQIQVAQMPEREITLSCAQGRETVAILGDGSFLRAGGLIYVCTQPLAGGLACTAGDQRHVIDYEERRAVFIQDDERSRSCTF